MMDSMIDSRYWERLGRVGTLGAFGKHLLVQKVASEMQYDLSLILHRDGRSCTDVLTAAVVHGFVRISKLPLFM